ncbi:alpha/beta fold hydrolase [Trichocoleus sp. FACHB-591]|uniref:alpha/beta fold hydrolase n=1 Tax=Trichocoleus sp. FACHB-591 TaxID=2692872 RepID=UPI0016884BC4|nr:alpha/beta fold hydrolase [Trichocoleus sp. FACHB-591]MBD2097241.1 alpha/beta fold hydrolase [Trichocoleus sp. FACHB-591]
MQQTPQDEYVWVGDVKTRYWSLGREGPTVILLHGIGSSVETWTLNLEALAQQHRVYAIDLVGSGRSSKPDTSYSLANLVAFVKTLMDVLGIDRASFVGNSMGGGIALQFALTHPQQVERLVLVNSLGLGQEISLSLRLANLPFADKLYQPTRSGTALFLRQAVFDPSLITDEWIDLFYEIMVLPGAKDTLFAQIRASVDWFGVRAEVYRPIRDRLNTMSLPVLVVWGKQDSILPVAHAQVAAQQLPYAQVHIFDACGHWSHLEQAEKFNDLVSRFLLSI